MLTFGSDIKEEDEEDDQTGLEDQKQPDTHSLANHGGSLL